MRALRGAAALLIAGLSAVALAGPAGAAPLPGSSGEHPAGSSPSSDTTSGALAPASVGADGLLGVAVAVPLTVPPASGGLLTAEELTDLTSPTGILTRQLDAAWGRTVALGIDPRILASIRVLGGSAPETATAWLDRLAVAPNETFALGYADADPVVGIQAGSPAPLAPLGFDFAIDPADFSAPADDTDAGGGDGTDGGTDGTGGEDGGDGQDGDPTGSPSPTSTDGTQDPDALPPLPQSPDDLVAWDYSLDAIAWPGDATVVTADLPQLAVNGYEHVVLSSANAGGAASARVSFTAGDIDGLVSDDALSALLREAVSAPTEADAAQASTRLAAGLASAAAAPDGALRLVTLGRDWPLGAYRLDSVVDEIAASGVARLATLAEATTIEPTPSTLVDNPEDGARVAAIGSALAAATREASFATVAIDPTLITHDRRLDLLALLAVGWQGDDFWPAAAQDFLDESTALLDAVQITQSSDLLALGRSAPLPVTVRNQLDVPIRVEITATALRPVLSIKQSDLPIVLEVPADSSAIGKVPADALTNGKVAVALSLASSTGVPIGERSQVSVDVHAEWETVGTLVAVILVVGVFGFGLIRRILTARRERAADAVSTGPSDAEPRG